HRTGSAQLSVVRGLRALNPTKQAVARILAKPYVRRWRAAASARLANASVVPDWRFGRAGLRDTRYGVRETQIMRGGSDESRRLGGAAQAAQGEPEHAGVAGLQQRPDWPGRRHVPGRRATERGDREPDVIARVPVHHERLLAVRGVAGQRAVPEPGRT